MNSQSRSRAILCLGLAAAVLPSVRGAQAAAAEGPVLASIDHITQEGLRREVFALESATPLVVTSEGSADSKGTVFLSQGWILDLKSRKPVWTVKGDAGSWDSKSENWRVEQEITLPAGLYAAYFCACGGPVPLDRELKVLGMVLGKFESSIGPMRRWDEVGDPSRWGIQVRALESGFSAVPAPAEFPGPHPDAEIRILGVSDNVFKRTEITLTRPVRFEIYATGEYDRGNQDFADDAWLTERKGWTRVWDPEFDTTSPAGGAEKNRYFEGTVRLPAGSYLLTVATDGSHAMGDWNSPPPWDPEAWGIAMKVVDPADRSAVRIQPDAGVPAPVVAITKVGNNAFAKKPFTAVRPVQALVRGEGEKSRGKDFADFGWIEDLATLEPVWHMRGKDSYPAGGDVKNRLIETLVELPRGSYALCYATDDSHAYGSWNAQEPRDPEGWGISIAELDESFAGGAKGGGRTGAGGDAIRPGEAKKGPTILSLAPVRCDQDLVKRFEITEPAKVRLIAVGEGTGDGMADHGWLVDEATGKKIWRMRYADSSPAGGAEKNRIVRAVLTLPKGSYALHFLTDDSHAFGDWNAPPPDQPELWGVTLVEQP